MATKQDQIDTAQAAALAEEIAAAASGKLDFDAGSLLQKIQDSGHVEQRVTSDAEDYVTVYDNWRGNASTIPLYMLSKKLRQRYPNESTFPRTLWGKPVFSLTRTVKEQVGTYTCWFNSESPMKEEMNELGYVGIECAKSNIPTAIEAENHMQHKHSREWNAIERHRTTKRADSQSNAMMELLKALVEREKEPNGSSSTDK